MIGILLFASIVLCGDIMDNISKKTTFNKANEAFGWFASKIQIEWENTSIVELNSYSLHTSQRHAVIKNT